MIGILGGGLSGVALAAYLHQPCTIIEAAPELGGLCRTVVAPGGYQSDLGPHIMFSRDPELLDEMTSVLGDNWHERPRRNGIVLGDRYVRWPLENHLGDLAPEDRAQCLLGFWRRSSNEQPANLEQWCRAAFGDALAELYLLPYNRKLWKRGPSELASDWCGRVPQPPLDDVVRGACQAPTVGHAHQAVFRYPKRGGIAALVAGYQFCAGDRLQAWTNERVQKVGGSSGAWRIDTTSADFRVDRVVSTIPLESLLGALSDVPGIISDAACRLEWLDLAVGFKATVESFGATADYIPGDETPAHRHSYPRSFSASMGPAEFRISETTIRHGDMGWPGALVPYAYPVPTLQTATARRMVLDYLTGLGIHCIGRAGTHSYLNMDDCVRDARHLAEELNR